MDTSTLVKRPNRMISKLGLGGPNCVARRSVPFVELSWQILGRHSLLLTVLAVAAIYGAGATAANPASPRQRRAFPLAVLACWAGAAAVMTIRGYGTGVRLHDLVLFHDLSFARYDTPDKQAVGNLLLFAPLGAGLLLLEFRLFSVVIVATGVSASFELSQWLLATGRVADVSDVVLNVLGAVLGAIILASGAKSRHVWRANRHSPRES